MTADEVARIITAAAARHGVAPEALMAIANIESSGNIRADNPRSSASGLFQFVDTTAREYGLTGAKRNDPVAQADAAAKMMATNSRSLARSLGRQPSPGELYLAHQQGLGGATALLSNPGRSAVDVLTGVYGNRDRAVQAVTLNGGKVGQSAGDFANRWVSKGTQTASLIPPVDIPNTVGTLTDTVPPRAVPPVTPTSIPPTVELARALNSGNMTSPGASFYNGMFPQPQPQQPVARQPEAIQANPSRANDLTYSGTITDTVNRSQSGQSQTLADALQAFINKPSAPPMPVNVGQSYAGQDRAPGMPSPPVPYSGGTTVASIPTNPAMLPKLPPSMLGLPSQSYAGQEAYRPAPYSSGTTVASVPTSPVPYSGGTTVASISTTPPPLPQPPPMPGPMNNIGSMPSMASMQSLQMPAPTVQGPSNGIGSMPSMADMAGLMMPKPVQTASLDYLPGPASMPKDQSRLQPSSGLPMNIPPEFQVGTALDTSPFNVGMGVPLPRPRPTPPTMPMPRPQMQTAQRPMPQAQQRTVPMPTSNLLRPIMQPPLQVAVNGANSYSGSSSGGGGGSSPAPRYEFQGREVSPQQTLRYDPDTNKFNTVTVYR
jgi:hypothetical protein